MSELLSGTCSVHSNVWGQKDFFVKGINAFIERYSVPPYIVLHLPLLNCKYIHDTFLWQNLCPHWMMNMIL